MLQPSIWCVMVHVTECHVQLQSKSLSHTQIIHSHINRTVLYINTIEFLATAPVRLFFVLVSLVQWCIKLWGYLMPKPVL